MNFNSRKEEYKSPFGAAAADTTVRFRFPIASWVQVDRLLLIIRKGAHSDAYNMSYTGSRDGYNIFEATFKPVVEGIYFYRFEMHNYDGIWYYGKGAESESVCGKNLPEWQLTVYASSYKTPDFAKGGIIYHIFADRFNRAGQVKTKREYRLHAGFNELPEVISPDGKYYADDFFGGNFKGIEQKLPYLKDLGVTVIYLSPIFKSFSNHRYDTGDYMQLDELLGTESDFKSLIDKAREEGIGIILDGVFNHSGADSLYFNKFGRYESVGAYQSKKSPYFNWYYFKNFPDKYACWWGCDNVPDLNKGNEGYRHLIFGVGGVIEKWGGLGIKGWRLDVVDELPVDFTYRLCDSIKRVDKNALILGEVWEDASTKVSYSEMRPYLLGSQLDGVMNYPFKRAIVDYVKGGSASEFKEKVMTIVENYPKCSLDCCMNIIGTHDTVRILTELSGVDMGGKSKCEKRGVKLGEAEYAAAREKVKAASVLQYALPGIPSIYYGDEAGMQGYEDPLNRAPFPWDGIDKNLLDHYKTLGRMRTDNREVFTGGIDFIRADDLLILRRYAEKNEIIFIMNNGGEVKEHIFDNDYVDIFSNLYYNRRQRQSFNPHSFTILKNK